MSDTTFGPNVFRRIGYLKIAMRDGLEEGMGQLPADRQSQLRERLKGYEDAIDDVLKVLRELRRPTVDEVAEQRRQEACEWLQAHNVDPDVFPEDARLRPTGTGWTFEVFAKNENGGTQKYGHGQPIKRQIHIPDAGNPPPAWIVERADDD
jgi:hypothetical protein